MRKRFLLILTSLLSLMLNGQNQPQIRSLERSLSKSQTDTAKVHFLIKLAAEYKMYDTIKALDYLSQIEYISKDSSYSEGQGMYHEMLGEMRLYHGNYHSAIQQFDKAITFYLHSGNEVRMADAIVDRGNCHLFLAEYDRALENYEAAIVYFEKHDYTLGLSRCFNNMGIIYKNYGDYERALNSYNQIVRIYEPSGNIGELLDTYINIGNVYVLKGDYHLALEYLKKSYQAAVISGDRVQTAIAQMNTGVIHNKMGNYAMALEYYEKALKISREIDDKIETAKCLTNIGTNYIPLGQYELAEEFINQGLELQHELGDIKSISNCYNFLAEIKFSLGEYEEALELDHRALELKYEIGDIEGIARCYSSLSGSWLALNKLQNARMCADSSLEYSLYIESLEHITSSYELQQEIAAAQGRYKDAYEYAKLFSSFNDSLLNENKARAVSEVEYEYQSKALEDENERLRLQMILDGEKLKRHKISIIALISAAPLFIGIFILLALIQKRQRKYNLSLEHKNHIITGQNLKLDKFNKTKDKILSVISHDLRGTIGNQLTALSILSEDEFKDDTERKLVFSRLANSATLSLGILENLMMWSKIQEGTLEFVPEEMRLDKILSDVIDSYSESFFNKQMTLKKDIAEDVLAYFDPYMMKFLLRNLLSNAIKFSNRGGAVSICCTIEDEQQLRLSIKDEGIGLSEGEIERLLKGEVSEIRRGTENEKGSGLGLHIVITFLKYHNSELFLSSEPGNGTEVSFLLGTKRT